MGRVSVALVALAERALTGDRYPTDSLTADMIKLKRLGPEAPGEREHAGLGGWRGAVGAKEDARRIGDITFKPSWRDEERRAMHRQRMALIVRIREKRALVALKRWATHPCRTEDDILPPLVREEPGDEDIDALSNINASELFSSEGSKKATTPPGNPSSLSTAPWSRRRGRGRNMSLMSCHFCDVAVSPSSKSLP
jgi:hypothetical protein